MLADLKNWHDRLAEYSEKEVGQTKVFLDGSIRCRAKECNLGSFIADAMVQAYNSVCFQYPRVSVDPKTGTSV